MTNGFVDLAGTAIAAGTVLKVTETMFGEKKRKKKRKKKKRWNNGQRRIKRANKIQKRNRHNSSSKRGLFGQKT